MSARNSCLGAGNWIDRARRRRKEGIQVSKDAFRFLQCSCHCFSCISHIFTSKYSKIPEEIRQEGGSSVFEVGMESGVIERELESGDPVHESCSVWPWANPMLSLGRHFSPCPVCTPGELLCRGSCSPSFCGLQLQQQGGRKAYLDGRLCLTCLRWSQVCEVMQNSPRGRHWWPAGGQH